MVSIARFPVAEQPWSRIAVALEQGEAACFANADAAAGPIERAAGLRRHQFERIETEQHAAAERIDAAHDGRISESEMHESLGLREDLGTGGARRADGDDDPFEP